MHQLRTVPRWRPSARSLGFARKLPIITGLLISASILGANYVESPALVIAFMSLAFFGNGLASITWSLVSAIAPARLLGLTGGMFNFVGNLASVGVPIVIGYLVKGGDFAPAITFIAMTAMAGATCGSSLPDAFSVSIPAMRADSPG